MKRLLILFLIINIQDTLCGGVFSSLSAQANQNQDDNGDNDSQLESFGNRDLIAEWETDEGVCHTITYLCSTDNTIDGVKFKICHSSTFAGRSTGCDYSFEWQDEHADFARQNDALVRKMQQVNNITERMILSRLASHYVFNR